MALRPEIPAAVYAIHHPGYGAVKVGVCSEPRRRITTHVRAGWQLLADFATPTARDGEEIERTVLRTLAHRVWEASGFGSWRYDGLPWHGTIGGCAHCGSPPATPVLRIRHEAFLTKAQMPQGGSSETFDARLVSPERAQLALYFAEAAHRAIRYPERDDGRDPFDVRRAKVEQAVREERSHIVCR
ncbi:GIY-YIG nuclease family protein [Streptomyces sp. NPDC058657]|uniref:GIY-YIG nuclease family protein n=1 Tax=unclassified Streptomyces TaxID=2593676 RepID=UPI003662554B